MACVGDQNNDSFILGHPLTDDFKDHIRHVSKNLIDLIPVIQHEYERCINDQSSIIPFANSKVDLLFLVGSDDGVTNSQEQVCCKFIEKYTFVPNEYLYLYTERLAHQYTFNVSRWSLQNDF